MGMPRTVDNRERDMFIEADEAELRKDPVWCHYLDKMGSQKEFTAAEVASIMKMPSTDDVYKLVDSGELRGFNRGMGNKRFVIFPRELVKQCLGRRIV